MLVCVSQKLAGGAVDQRLGLRPADLVDVGADQFSALFVALREIGTAALKPTWASTWGAAC